MTLGVSHNTDLPRTEADYTVRCGDSGLVQFATSGRTRSNA
jgi:hypothetical protein